MTDKDPVLEQVVSNFRIVEQLGAGGMGGVYLGRHLDIDSKVAIKVLHAQYVGEASMAQRFLDEARAVNRVEHPGLVKIHDCGRHPELGLYLVMELLRGRTLRQLIKEQAPLPPAEALLLVDQLVAVLAAVHAEQIVHRDLKPENIMLVPDALVPGGERVKVLDFGLAKLKLAGANPDGQTKTGHVMGTPLYMAPEQCVDAKRTDARTDIYSLACIAYELLAGKPPFSAASMYELVRKHLTMKPQGPISTVHAVPQPMERAIFRSLSIDPADRFGRVELFGAALHEEDKSGRGSTLAYGQVGAGPAADELPDAVTLEQMGEAPTDPPPESLEQPEPSMEVLRGVKVTGPLTEAKTVMPGESQGEELSHTVEPAEQALGGDSLEPMLVADAVSSSTSGWRKPAAVLGGAGLVGLVIFLAVGWQTPRSDLRPVAPAAAPAAAAPAPLDAPAEPAAPPTAPTSTPPDAGPAPVSAVTPDAEPARAKKPRRRAKRRRKPRPEPVAAPTAKPPPTPAKLQPAPAKTQPTDLRFRGLNRDLRFRKIKPKGRAKQPDNKRAH